MALEIKPPEDFVLKVEAGATFEQFVSQFQVLCPKLLCVVNGTQLRYYNKRNEFPTTLQFAYKRRREAVMTKYYFRDTLTSDMYCVFGRTLAQIFYPRLNEVDPVEMVTVPVPAKLPILQLIPPDLCSITDKGVRHSFPYPNHPVHIRIFEPQSISTLPAN